jgi:hypothetical protein
MLTSAISQFILHINSNTWPRDSHGLFDYESKHFEVSHFYEASPSYLVRVGSSVLTTHDLSAYAARTGFSLLGRIEPVKEGYLLCPCEDGEALWLIAARLGDAGFEISSGDVIKLGRLQFVARLDGSRGRCSSFSTHTESSEDAPALDDIRECRICFTECEESADPLISPCLCTGSMKYIHYNCLRRWLETRMVARVNPNYSHFYWKSLSCELCKAPFPLNYTDNGTNYPLCDVDKGDSPSIILEALSKDHSAGQGVTAIAVSQDCSVKLGRGHESDVRIPDISVSRCHAELHNRDGRFFIADCQSKFGTLVQIRRPLLLAHHSHVSVQIGRSVLNFEVRSSAYIPKPQCDETVEEDELSMSSSP